MNPLSFYDRSKTGWTSDEANAVLREYETEMLSILDIADLHRRTPGSIAYKLKSMGVISDASMARGYAAYKSGNLYKEIISSSSSVAREPVKYAQKQPNEIVLRIASNDEILAEVKSLKSELSELKSEFKDLKVHLMLLVEKMSVKPEHPSNPIESTFDVDDLEQFFDLQ
jgi:hypothetical protein